MYASERPIERVLLWFGVAAPVMRHAAIYGFGAATDDYSASTDFISEIGALDAPYSLPMNALGIGLIGAMMLLASWALFNRLATLPGGRASALLIALSGFSFVLVALFPCDPGCNLSTHPNARMIIHMFSGFIAMGAEVAAALTPGLMFLRRPRRTLLGALALGLGTIGVAAYLVLLNLATSLDYPGLVQRIVQVAGDGWLLAACIACLRTRPAA